MDSWEWGGGFPCLSYYNVKWLGLRQNTETVAFLGIPCLQFGIFWVVEVILQTRIFALYGSKRLAILNGVLFAAEIAGMLLLWHYMPAYCYFPQFYQPEELWDPSEPVFQCGFLGLYWIPGIAFELWLAGLAAAKLRPRILKHDLLTVIVHDSIKYFIVIALVMIVHVVSAFKGIGRYAIPFVVAGQTIGGSRLVLHLRKAFYEGPNRNQTGVSRPNATFAFLTQDDPPPRHRLVDQSFYVQDEIEVSLECQELEEVGKL